MYQVSTKLLQVNGAHFNRRDYLAIEKGADIVVLKRRAFSVAQAALQALGHTVGTARIAVTIEKDGKWMDAEEFEIELVEVSPWKTLNVRMFCQAYYDSSLQVPAGCTVEEAIEYAKAYINYIPINKGRLEYIPCSDVLDEENCDFAEENAQ